MRAGQGTSGDEPAGTPGPRVRLLLADDQKIIRVGLRDFLGMADGFAVVGEAASAASAIAEARRCQPDVVIMDERFPDGSGTEACREIVAERPQTRVIMLTAFAGEELLRSAIAAGAAGYLLKEEDPQRLVEAVEAAMRGERPFGPASTRAALARIRRANTGRGCQGGTGREADLLDALSEQERAIAPLVAKGRTNREIAAELFLSNQTVKSHVAATFRKLRLTRRAELAALFAQAQADAA